MKCVNKGITKQLLMFLGVFCVLLSGCASTSATYQNVYNQSQQELANISEAASETAAMSFGEILYNFAQGAKEIAPMAIAGSMALGTLLLLIVRKERTWRKKIVGFFIIGIPVLMFLLSYGLAILVSVYSF